MDAWQTDLDGVVTLPDGRSVRGRALRGPDTEGRSIPDFGVYLASMPHDESRWGSIWVCWPDFLLPLSSRKALQALEEAHDRSASTKVEIGCAGGIGRTGTAIAILARMAGVPRGSAVEWVRQNYSPRAVETPWQRTFAARAELPPRGTSAG